MKDKEAYFKALAWSLGVSVKYIKSHYEDYIQFYEFKAEQFYSIIKLFLKNDGGKIITKKGFK